MTTPSQSAISNLQSEIAGLIKPTVLSLSPYTLSGLSAERKLNQNESPFDVPEHLKREVIERALATPWNRYPEFVPQKLVEQIAAKHDWDPEGVLVGNGSNEVIQASISVAVNTGDPVVVPQPSFALYRIMTGVMGGRYLPVPLGPEYAYDVDALVAVARRERARVVVLNSPNNPTGSVLPDNGVATLLERTEALLLCDEAYQDFGGPTALTLLRHSPRIVVLRTLSKAMGMAGLRFGYALAHPEIAREIAKAKLPYNVNAITLAAAEVMLKHSAVFAARARSIAQERDRFLGLLGSIAGLHPFTSKANFVLVRCDRVPAHTVFRRLVEEHGILVRDVSSGAGLAECLRISVGTREDTDAVVAGLSTILGN
ncbi:MAG TPA: histidinol-phosphate transaminase [Gemmatimonadales bacterium]|nr:histidinol-phosphate transaminase [Gemmatimonadales bacterium]